MVSDKAFVFGVNPVLEKLRAAPNDILEVLISDHSSRAVLRLIARDAARLGLQVVHVPPRVLDRLAGGQRHQGVIAKVAGYHYSSVDLLLQQVSGKVSSEWILILDGLTDPRNFGALLRTAEAVGVHHVIIPKHRSVDVTPLVVKASSGAAYNLNIVKATNLRRVMTELKSRGYWIIGLDARGRQNIYDQTYPAQVAIVLGSEGKGIRQINLHECDFVASIPMLGRIESLNVSVAGAIFLYELLRQSRSASKA
jgi:23S rRNA (guanosine2251-2'-O)-methyltransferase